MTKDILVVIVIATIVEDPYTTPVSVRLPTRKEKIHQKGGVEEMNHLQAREGVYVIIMNEDPLEEVRIQRGKTSHQRATQDEDIKLMLVNGFLAPTLTTTPTKVITLILTIFKMMVLLDLLSYPPTHMTYLIH